MTTPSDPERARREREALRDRHMDHVRILLGAVAVVLLGMLVWYAWDSRDTAEEAVSQTQSLAQQVQSACKVGGAAERELESIGACEQADQAARGAATETQAPVVDVATPDQVRAAVAEYLDRNPPADGHTPTQAEVDSAVSRYCEANACRGADGANGADGADGADGDDGASGADATDDQVAAQVAEYCADNNGCLPTPEEIQAAVAAYCSPQPSPCVGPQGAEGPPGPVLPEYYTTRPNGLGVGTITYHCVLRPETDAAAPPHYDCEVSE